MSESVKGADLILRVLDLKKKKNNRYSLKALGRDLKISQPQLTKIINGDRRLSPQIALKVGRHLNLSDKELLNLLLSTMQ